MDRDNEEVKRWGPRAFLIIILIDIAVIAVGWVYLQQRKGRYDSTEFDVKSVPTAAPEAAAPAAPEAAPPTAGAGTLSFVVKEEGARAPAEEAPKSKTRARDSGGSKEEETGPQVRAAKQYFYDLKNHPRFKNSKALKQWEKDFLSHADLRDIDARYQEDRNAVKFVTAVVRSPSFGSLVNKNLGNPDIQAFLMSMTGSKSVAGASSTFLKDSKVEEMVDRLEIPGVGRVGNLLGRREKN